MREERRAGIDPGGRGCHDACLLPLLASGPEPATDGLDGSSKGPGVSRASSATLYLKLRAQPDGRAPPRPRLAAVHAGRPASSLQPSGSVRALSSPPPPRPWAGRRGRERGRHAGHVAPRGTQRETGGAAGRVTRGRKLRPVRMLRDGDLPGHQDQEGE